MLDMSLFQHSGEQFRGFHIRCSYKHRAFFGNQSLYLSNNRRKFFPLCLIYKVFVVFPYHRAVRRNGNNVQFINVPQLSCLRFGSTGHTCEFGIHSEVVLQSDCGIRLSGCLDLYSFLCLYRLVQAVRITSSFHYTTRLFIDNLHLVVYHDVFHIVFKQSVGFQQLIYRMNPVGLHCEVLHYLVLLLCLLLSRQILLFQIGKLASDIGQHEKLRVFAQGGKIIHTFIRQFYGIVLFVYHEIKFIVYHVHFLVLILHVEVLGLQQQGFHAGFGQEFYQSFVLRQAVMSPEQKNSSLLFFLRCTSVNEFLLCIRQYLRYKLFLCIVNLFNHRTEPLELLIVALRCRSGDDKRCSGIVYQDGIDLIDYCIVVFPLYDFLGVAAHVVPKVIEAEFIVRTVGNVRIVCTASFFRVRLVLIDAIDAQTVELEKHSHPFAISLCQIIVHRYHMHTLSGQSVKVYR